MRWDAYALVCKRKDWFFFTVLSLLGMTISVVYLLSSLKLVNFLSDIAWEIGLWWTCSSNLYMQSVCWYFVDLWIWIYEMMNFDRNNSNFSLLHFTLVAPFLSSLMKLCLLRIRESKLKIDIVELTFHRCEIPNLIVQCRISTMKWIIRSCLYREREEGSMCGYEHQFVAPLSFYLNKIIWQDQLPLHFNSLKKKFLCIFLFGLVFIFLFLLPKQV